MMEFFFFFFGGQGLRAEIRSRKICDEMRIINTELSSRGEGKKFSKRKVIRRKLSSRGRKL